MTIRQKKQPTPSTNKFNDYIETVARPLLHAKHSRTLANQLLLVLYYLEGKRYDFSKDRAYQTRPICINEIAVHFNVSHRSVQRWLATLEETQIVTRQYRKDPTSRYKNKFSRIGFPAFKTWFFSLLKAAYDTVSHPTKKDNLQLSINDQKLSEKKQPSFPKSGGLAYEPLWRELAYKHLPNVNRPCTTMIAEKFRKHLKSLGIPFHHKSIEKRWINYCSKAKPIR